MVTYRQGNRSVRTYEFIFIFRSLLFKIILVIKTVNSKNPFFFYSTVAYINHTLIFGDCSLSMALFKLDFLLITPLLRKKGSL